MKGKTLLSRAEKSIFETDFAKRNSKGKRTSGLKASAKVASRKIRQAMKRIDYDPI